MREILRVLAADGLRVRMADERGQTCTPAVRHLLITPQGLYDERTRSTTPGPVEVPATPYITRLVAAGNLLEAKPEAPPAPPVPVPPVERSETKPHAEKPRTRGRAEE
jgi:hypothetical protein